MAKKHTLTALLTATYVIIMITIMLANVNISEDGSFEKFYDDNGGLIWACTTILVVALFVNKYLDVQAEKERKESIDKSILLQETIVTLQKTIVKQNDKSAEIQTDHIEEFGKITEKLNKNEASDNEVLREMLVQTKKIDSFMKGQEKRDVGRDKEMSEVKEWMKNHDELHKGINLNSD